MTLRQLNSDLAIVDTALAELEERRTAIIHRIVRFHSYRRGSSGILQFPNVPTVDTHTGGHHVWSSEPNFIGPRVTSLPITGKRKPTGSKVRKEHPDKTLAPTGTSKEMHSGRGMD
jgi:hypothetical protein